MNADPRWARPTTIRLPVAMLTALDRQAQTRRVSRSALVVGIVRAWLAEHGEPEPTQPTLGGFHEA